MSNASDRKFVVGLLLGLGLGLTAAVLLSGNGGARRRDVLADRAREVADRVTALGIGATKLRERKTKRAERALMDRIERARSAGL